MSAYFLNNLFLFFASKQFFPYDLFQLFEKQLDLLMWKYHKKQLSSIVSLKSPYLRTYFLKSSIFRVKTALSHEITLCYVLGHVKRLAWSL